MLDEGVERALLTDFGLARTEDDARLTRTGFQPGTPNYMSPEQIRAESIDGRSDLFSLGCVLYALCTGRPPFRAETGYAVLRRITDDAPRSICEVNSDIPDWLEQIVMKLLEKDRDQRFQSAEEVAETLGRWLAHVQQPSLIPAPAWPNPQPTHAGTRLGMIKYLVGVAACLLFLIAGVVIVLETGKGTIRIESELDGVPIRIRQGDQLVESLTVTTAGTSVRVAAGNYLVEVAEGVDEVKVDNGIVSLGRGSSEVVRISQSDANTSSPQKQQLAAELTGKWRLLSTTVAGREGDTQNDIEFVIIGDRTIHFPHDKHPANYAYQLRPNGDIILQAWREGRIDYSILGKIEVSKQRLYLAWNDADGGTRFPKRARVVNVPDAEEGVTYYELVRETWSEDQRRQSQLLDQSIPRIQSDLIDDVPGAISESAGSQKLTGQLSGRWYPPEELFHYLDQSLLPDKAGFEITIDKNLGDSHRRLSDDYYQTYSAGLAESGHVPVATGQIRFDHGSEAAFIVTEKDNQWRLHYGIVTGGDPIIFFGKQESPGSPDALVVQWEVGHADNPLAEDDDAMTRAITYYRLDEPTADPYASSAKFGNIRLTDEMCRIIGQATFDGRLALSVGDEKDETQHSVGVLVPAGLFEVEFRPVLPGETVGEMLEQVRMTVTTGDGEIRERVISTEQIVGGARQSGKLKIRYAFGDDGPVRGEEKLHFADIHFDDESKLPVYLTFQSTGDVGFSSGDDSFSGRIQGRWRIVRQVASDGDAQAVPRNATFEFKGNTLIFEDSIQRESATWSIDEMKFPIHIDIKINGNSNVGRGLVALEEGRLKICLTDLDAPDAPRPTSLEPTPGYWYMELLRPEIADATEQESARLPTVSISNPSVPPPTEGEWSEVVNGLQARMILVDKGIIGKQTRWLVPYLELRNVRDSADPMEVNCDTKSLKIDLVDQAGILVKDGWTLPRSGPHLPLSTIMLRQDSTNRISLECRNWGISGAAMVATDGGAWAVSEAENGELYLAARLTVETNKKQAKAWHGELSLPLVRVGWSDKAADN
ncbi:MAG: serine/threonine protein kinase [Planctomycetales bacterium]|nr:serine/threonine protein kinase [Planctomycetales bacterium]